MNFRNLLNDTIVYGMGTFLSRGLNYLIVPLHTYVFLDNMYYGVIGELYAFAAIFNILLSYGVETAIFRFFNQKKINIRLLSTLFWFICFLSIIFLFIFISQVEFIRGILRMDNQKYYSDILIYLFAFILFFDNLSTIPLALLRLRDRAKTFIKIKLSMISINLFCNFFFLLFIPILIEISDYYKVMWVFVANLIASFFAFFLLTPYLQRLRFVFHLYFFKKYFFFATPLTLGGVFMICSETLDRILLKAWLTMPIDSRLSEIGIYNANYKLSLIMVLCVQAFRLSMEPYFFKNDSNLSKALKGIKLAIILEYFSWFCCLLFMVLVTFAPIFKYLIGASYREGIIVVPILLLAHWFLGMFFQLSFWYKSNDQTYWSLIFSVLGFALTLLFNYILIPHFGYVGCAITTLLTYFGMFLASLLTGKKINPVPYKYQVLMIHIIYALIFYFTISLLVNTLDGWIYFFLCFGFIFFYIYILEKKKVSFLIEWVKNLKRKAF